MSQINPMHCEIIDIQYASLSLAQAFDFVCDDAFGGIDMFIGRVRAQSRGRQCIGIHYDMFDPLVIKLFQHAAQQTINAFGTAIRVYVAHAKGQLKVGDLAVIVAVGTPHRDEAFRACRQVIETVKHQAPIWKQEHFIDGSSQWSEGCSLCGTTSALTSTADQTATHSDHHHHHHAHDESHQH